MKQSVLDDNSDEIPSVLSESWYFSETVCALIPVPMEMRKMVPCVAIVVTKELKCGDELLLDYNLCEEVAKDELWYVLRCGGRL